MGKKQGEANTTLLLRYPRPDLKNYVSAVSRMCVFIHPVPAPEVPAELPGMSTAPVPQIPVCQERFPNSLHTQHQSVLGAVRFSTIHTGLPQGTEHLQSCPSSTLVCFIGAVRDTSQYQGAPNSVAKPRPQSQSKFL